MKSFERLREKLSTWRQGSASVLLPVAVLLVMLGAREAVAAETMVLQIPSTTMTLPNGLTVVVSAKHKLPMVSISARFKVGAVDDPEDKAGLAAMAARLLDKGTTQRPATAIADELDLLGAHLEAGAGGTGSTVSLSLLAKDVEVGLDLLADLVQHSRFDAAELERERAQVLSEIHQQLVDPGYVVSEIFRETLYAGHPLHRPISGYAHTVPQITREDVVAFHQRFYVPNNAIVVMVGAIPEAHMLEVIARYLGTWPARPLGPAGTATTGPNHRATGAHRGYGGKPELCSVGTLVGSPGRSGVCCHSCYELHPRRGDFVSRLVDSIREQQGLAYAVDSEFVGKPIPRLLLR